MKHNLFTLGLVSLLTGLGSPQACAAEDLSASPIKSRIEALGYGEVKDLSPLGTGGWKAHVVWHDREMAVLVDKGGRILVQADDKQQAARCNLLYSIASRSVSGGAGANGGSAPDLGVIGAGLDCQKGHYDAGIRTLERILDGQRIAHPRG